MNFNPPIHNIDLKFKKIVRVISGHASIIEHTYVIEIKIDKGLNNEIYTTKKGRFFIRLLASNRELTGHSLIEYVKTKCLINK